MTSTLWGLPAQRVGALARHATAAMQPQHPRWAVRPWRVRLEPCMPSPGTKVPDRLEWICEIKHDGYRLIDQRDGKRVRLWTRNGQTR